MLFIYFSYFMSELNAIYSEKQQQMLAKRKTKVFYV